MLESTYLQEILKVYGKIAKDIDKRLKEFKEIWKNGSDEDIHAELSFCILTPQSKARNAWKAITTLRADGVLFIGDAQTISDYLNIVRFKNNKAKYLVELREQMKNEKGEIITKQFFNSLPSTFEKREWIVKNIKGMSYKEAGHFLRNVGFGEDVAILDRHVLKNLVKLEVISEIPKTITPKLYLEIEEKLRVYCKEVGIGMDQIDLLLWYLEAGEIFK
ncbi:MAG: N-glycosylase/DNA lyase [Fusobacteriaceae bacterium]|nr:N-glycosylase/DNA lyase [Fusobacteriaceae bacterium]